MRNYDDVGAFHYKFGLPSAGEPRTLAEAPHLLEQRDFEFRLAFLLEEIQELIRAHSKGDLVGSADALIDLVYVAMGAGHMMGLPWQPLWNEVQRANLAKERATGDHDPRSKRGYAKDIVKPPGWRSPELAAVLRSYGYQR